MSWIARLVNVFRAEKVSEDIDRELAFHLAERTDAVIADGTSPEAASREARRRSGNYTGQRENTRDRDLLVWLESFGADVRYGLRGLIKRSISPRRASSRWPLESGPTPQSSRFSTV